MLFLHFISRSLDEAHRQINFSDSAQDNYDEMNVDFQLRTDAAISVLRKLLAYQQNEDLVLARMHDEKFSVFGVYRFSYLGLELLFSIAGKAIQIISVNLSHPPHNDGGSNIRPTGLRLVEHRRIDAVSRVRIPVRPKCDDSKYLVFCSVYLFLALGTAIYLPINRLVIGEVLASSLFWAPISFFAVLSIVLCHRQSVSFRRRAQTYKDIKARIVALYLEPTKRLELIDTRELAIGLFSRRTLLVANLQMQCTKSLLKLLIESGDLDGKIIAPLGYAPRKLTGFINVGWNLERTVLGRNQTARILIVNCVISPWFNSWNVGIANVERTLSVRSMPDVLPIQSDGDRVLNSHSESASVDRSKTNVSHNFVCEPPRNEDHLDDLLVNRLLDFGDLDDCDDTTSPRVISKAIALDTTTGTNGNNARAHRNAIGSKYPINFNPIDLPQHRCGRLASMEGFMSRKEMFGLGIFEAEGELTAMSDDTGRLNCFLSGISPLRETKDMTSTIDRNATVN
jgi:hypothetical protein